VSEAQGKLASPGGRGLSREESGAVMIYGAYGYTGRLMVAHATRTFGWRPILAGRDADRLREVADTTGCQVRVFSLSDPNEVCSNLNGVRVVIHAAGPFSATSKPMLDACVAVGCHYLDITGEIDVFEAIFARDAELRAKGIAAVPGVGFDVVPTDCLAASLKERLPNASSLTLAFMARGGISAGTTRTMIESLHRGIHARRGGKIVTLGLDGTPSIAAREFSFEMPASRSGETSTAGAPASQRKLRWCAPVSWGDVSTAWHSTGIPDITVFTAMPRRIAKLTGAVRRLAPLLAQPLVQDFLKGLAGQMVRGSDAEEIASGFALVYGEAENKRGEIARGHVATSHPYDFTARAALAAAGRCLAGEVRPGAHTPSRAFGPAFLTGIPGTSMTTS